MGKQLADTFASRGKQSLKKVLVSWSNKDEITRQELEALGNAYGLDSPAQPSEKKVWEDAVAGWVQRAPHSKCFWEDPLSEEELNDMCSSAVHYRSFFPTLEKRYPNLKSAFDQASRFETMSAICLFIFEREYLLCHDAGTAIPEIGNLEKNLASRLCDLAKISLANQDNLVTKDWTTAFATDSDYKSVSKIIVQHHEQHQKSKSAQPYMENGQLRVRERFDRDTFTEMHEEISELTNAAQQIDLLTYYYRRDWHFDRAIRYLRYFR